MTIETLAVILFYCLAHSCMYSASQSKSTVQRFCHMLPLIVGLVSLVIYKI